MFAQWKATEDWIEAAEKTFKVVICGCEIGIKKRKVKTNEIK